MCAQRVTRLNNVNNHHRNLSCAAARGTVGKDARVIIEYVVLATSTGLKDASHPMD
jgi:hypothetical protein